jgi:hypothetical protein
MTQYYGNVGGEDWVVYEGGRTVSINAFTIGMSINWNGKPTTPFEYENCTQFISVKRVERYLKLRRFERFRNTHYWSNNEQLSILCLAPKIYCRLKNLERLGGLPAAKFFIKDKRQRWKFIDFYEGVYFYENKEILSQPLSMVFDYQIEKILKFSDMFDYVIQSPRVKKYDEMNVVLDKVIMTLPEAYEFLKQSKSEIWRGVLAECNI